MPYWHWPCPWALLIMVYAAVYAAAPMSLDSCEFVRGLSRFVWQLGPPACTPLMKLQIGCPGCSVSNRLQTSLPPPEWIPSGIIIAVNLIDELINCTISCRRKAFANPQPTIELYLSFRQAVNVKFCVFQNLGKFVIAQKLPWRLLVKSNQMEVSVMS